MAPVPSWAATAILTLLMAVSAMICSRVFITMDSTVTSSFANAAACFDLVHLDDATLAPCNFGEVQEHILAAIFGQGVLSAAGASEDEPGRNPDRLGGLRSRGEHQRRDNADQGRAATVAAAAKGAQ